MAWALTLAVSVVRTATRTPVAAPASSRVRSLGALGLSQGRPALLVGWDPACGACDLTRSELDRLQLEEAGVAVASLSRHDPAASGLGLDRGPFPAYLLLDGEGRVRGARRGYATPEALHLWVRSRLLASP